MLYNITCYILENLLMLANNSKKPGTRVLQYEYHGGNNQKWIIKDAGNGYFNIISKSNGLYLDIPHSDAHDGSLVQVWTSEWMQ